MSLSAHFAETGRKGSCAAVILLAVCSLTVNVATRYGISWSDSSHAVKTVQTHACIDAKRQRLDKKAVHGTPALTCFGALENPTYDRRVSLPGPPASRVLFRHSLYNRPPPVV